MMDVITGKTRPDAGKVFFGQTLDLTRRTEPDIASLGIGRKFQKPTVFETLTTFENLELALKADKRARTTVGAKLGGAEIARIDEILYTTNLEDHAFRLAGLLSHGQKQWLEIGMLLSQDPKLLLLDEPVAGMTDHETERTAELFVSLEGKHSLIVVEHDMDFIASIARGRRITVLAEGSVLAEGTMEEIQRDEAVIEAYLGR
jgi:urea transport system ATP-binding protein